MLHYITDNMLNDYYLEHRFKDKTVLVIYVGTRQIRDKDLRKEWEILNLTGEKIDLDNYVTSDMIVVEMSEIKARHIIKNTHPAKDYPYMQLWVNGKYVEENT